MFIPPRPEFNGDYFLAFGLAERQSEWDKQYGNMNKAQATEALKSGYKISHTTFLPTEHIKMVNWEIMDENNLCLQRFWEYRGSKKFENGWFPVFI